jgi:phosphoglycolate phosphatase (TIGR01487 family)
VTRPLAVDIDGTLSRADASIDGRALDALREREAPVVVATGKALPYPVALCQFAGVETRVVAENGGVAATDDAVTYHGDREAVNRAVAAYRDLGHDLGWGDANLVNRWRETEAAVAREAPLEPLETVAARHGLEVVDTGFAYHVKPPDVSKGRALRALAGDLGLDPGEFVAVGDSENDVSMFEVAGRSYAVANADEAARAAADRIVAGSHADGFLEAVHSADAETSS